MKTNKVESKAELPNHRQELVDMIIDNLSKGHIPWHRGWSNEDYPQNAITGKPYRGVNHLLLSMLPFSDNRYCTFVQAKEKGWKIRKGAKGIQIELYKLIDLRTNKDVDWEKIKSETAKMSASEKQEFYKKNIRTLLKTYVVFNAEFIDGIPPIEIKPIDPDIAAAKDLRAEKIIANSESKIYHNGNGQNYYRTFTDTIHLCKVERFDNMQNYYATAFHEMGHSTGHKSRLNRDMSGGFGSIEYAKEELAVELSSMFLQQDIGMQLSDEHIENHSAYIQSWIKMLKDEPRELFNAVSSANKIAKYILNLENKGESVIDDEHDVL